MVVRYLFIVLIVLYGTDIKSQNLIINPDFSDVSIIYQDSKKVYPNNWKSLNWPPFPYFVHPAKSESNELFGKNKHQKFSNGIVGINILHPSEGIITKLRNTLKEGQIYDLEIDLRINKVGLNSDWKESHLNSTGRKLDSIELDYNYLISLVTFFSPTEPSLNNKKSRRFAIFEFPSHITIDSTNWLKLSIPYTAHGDEAYFAIGANDTDDYIEILHESKNDRKDYLHKWANYLIRKVSILPVNNIKERNILFFNKFDPDSITQKSNNGKFVFRDINFDLGRFELTDSSKNELNKIATFLGRNIDISLRITGHTDTIGTNQLNQVLSERRAQSVGQYLISHGVKEKIVTFEGKGESQPLNDRLSKENFGRNRRVEFEFFIEK